MSNFIRYADIGDSDILGAIHSQSLIASFKGIIPDGFLYENFSYEKRKNGLHGELIKGSPKTAIIYKDNHPAGMISFGDSRYSEKEESLIEIWRIYILPAYWRTGVGTKLMTWGMNEIRNEGFKKAELWVLEENLRARHFYEKLGFRHDGTTQTINCGKDLIECRYTIDV